MNALINSLILIIFLISCYSIGLFFSRVFKFEFKFFSLIGYIVYLITAFIAVMVNLLLFNSSKIFSYGIFTIIFIVSFIYLIWNFLSKRKHNEIKQHCFNIVLIICIVIGVGLILTNYTNGYPRMYGTLENGTNYLSLINNNFYSSKLLNIDISTGQAIEGFAIEAHLGFYSLLDFVLKCSNKLISNFNPISFSIYFTNQLLLNLIVQVFATFVIDFYRNKKAYLLAVGFALIAFTFGFNTLNYGFVSYLYQPLLIGIVFYYFVTLDGSKPLLCTFLSLSLVTISANGWLMVILLNIIIYLSVILYHLHLSINRIVTIIIISISIVLIYLLNLDISVLFDHHAFDYGYEYISRYKNIIILSISVYCLSIWFSKRSNLLFSTLVVVSPLLLTFLIKNDSYGFLALDILFNFGIVFATYALLNESLESVSVNLNRIQTLFIGLSLLSLYVDTNMNEDTYQLHVDLENQGQFDNYSKEMHIDNESLAIFEQLNQITMHSNNRVKVISQHPMTNAYVSNIELLFSREHINNLCQYCDVVNDNIHEPNPLTNIFDYREYADNVLYIEKPQYNNACSLLHDDNYEYLLIQNERYVNVDGNYLSYDQLLEGCAQVIYSTEKYSLYKVNY